jgi:hypothetical protein
MAPRFLLSPFALAHPDNFPTIDEDALMNARAAIAKAGG